MREAGVCILFVSHSTEIVHRNCDKAMLIEGGKLSAYDCADTVIGAYHDLLYGSGRTKKVDAAATPLEQNRVAIIYDAERETCPELEAFMEKNQSSFCTARHYYNPNERRFGSGGAEIVDIFVTADGETNFSAISGSESLSIYLKVRYQRDTPLPQVGWAIVSPEGIVIAGSNTAMCNISLAQAHSGETWIYEVRVLLNLCGGDYFLNIGIGEIANETWAFLDNRRSVIHLAVAHNDKATGFFYLPFKCQVVSTIDHE